MANVDFPRVASAHGPATLDRILNVAESLLAEKGVHETSVRDITQKAGVNVAAVNYHFVSKDGLIHAVINRRFESLEHERSRALDEVERRCELERRPPKPEELAEVLVGPLFDRSRSGDEGWLNFLRFMTRLAWEPGAEKFSPPSTSLKIFERLDGLLKKAVPSLANDDGRRGWRIAFMRAANQQTLLMIQQLRNKRPINAIAFADALNKLDDDAIRRELITFVSAGLAAQ